MKYVTLSKTTVNFLTFLMIALTISFAVMVSIFQKHARSLELRTVKFSTYETRDLTRRLDFSQLFATHHLIAFYDA